MKQILLTGFIISLTSFSNAQSTQDLQISGDQLYEDGFTSQAWQKYEKAFLTSKNVKTQSELLIRLSKSAINANRQKETISHLSKFLSSKKLSVQLKSELILYSALIKQNIGKYKEAGTDCLNVLNSAPKLPAEIQEKILETAVFSLVKDSRLEDASKIIEKYKDSFQNSDSIELQNARLKILMGQFVSAVAILEKFAESKDPFPQFLSLWAYMKSGDTGKAHEIFAKHLSGLNQFPDPAFTSVLIKLAESTYKEKIAESAMVLDKAFTIEPDANMKAYILLKKAELLILAAKDEDAILNLKQYLKLFPQSNKVIQVQLQLAELYFRSDKQDLVKGTALLNAIVDKNPENKRMLYSALMLRAEVKEAIGTLQEAAGDFTSAAQLAQAQKLSADEITFPLFRAGMAKYLEAEKEGILEAFNDAANSFYSAASIKSSYRMKAALMQVQSLRKAESYTSSVETVKQWLKIYPKDADLNYLLGICLLEANKVEDGVKSLQKFIKIYKTDSRIPMAYVYAVNSSIYNANSQKMVKGTESLIIEFEGAANYNKPLSQQYKTASPYIRHLKAIFAWKNGFRIVAENLWANFLKEFPEHSLAPEIHLWLAFKARTSEQPDFNDAVEQYNTALTKLEDSSLKGYSFLQLGKSYKRQYEFENAVKAVEEAIAVYKKLKLDDKLTQELSSLLFYAGDLYARIGEYEDKSIPAYLEAEKLASDLNVKSALKGRIADCYFTAAGLISGNDEKVEEYQEKLKKALTLYKEIAQDSNSTVSIQEQALYKLAKCHETLGNLKEKSQLNKDLDDARRYYEKIFFGFQNDLKQGKKRDPYYFCRAGYDLARMHLNYDEVGMLPAITTYTILGDSGFPGTLQAKHMSRFLKQAQRKAENE